MITELSKSINSTLNQFPISRLTQILHAFIVGLCILIFSCSKDSVVHYTVHLPNRDCSFAIDTNLFKFEFDSTKVYIGDPILFSFVNKTKGGRFDMYIGTKDPIPDWRYTFDFQESIRTLEEQVTLDTANQFIRKLSIEYWDCPGKLVQYSFEKWKRIESQFICFEEIRVNVVLTTDIKLDDDILLSEFKTAIKAIELREI